MSFWVSKGNWFKLDPLVYYAHPYLITGGLTSHCLLDLRFDFSFRIGAKIFFEFFFISSLYGYFKFHSFSEKKMYNYKTFCRLESKFVNFSIPEKFVYVIFPTNFTKTNSNISGRKFVFNIFVCVKRSVQTLNCNPKRYLFQKGVYISRSPRWNYSFSQSWK